MEKCTSYKTLKNAALLATMLVLTVCGGGDVIVDRTISRPTIGVTDVSLDKTAIVLAVGGTAKLVETVSPSSATNKSVTWASSDDSVASVNAGTVVARSPGSAAITATTQDGGKQASCAVTVVATHVPVSSVSLDKAALALAVGGTAKLVETVSPSSATNKSVAWASSDDSVASVNAGTVVARSPGSAAITATTQDGGKQASCIVTVSAKYATPPNVYVAGWEADADGTHLATIWNGAAMRLGAGGNNAEARSVYVSGSDVYAAGYQRDGYSTQQHGKTIAALWKNGAMQRLSDGYSNAAALSVRVSGSNVYVSGYDGASSDISGETASLVLFSYRSRFGAEAVLWKDGFRQRLGSERSTDSIAFSVHTSGGEAYAAGVERDENGVRFATLWKGTSSMRLPVSGLGACAGALYVSGSDIYAVGYEYHWTLNDMAVIWKNGSPHRLTNGSRWAYAEDVFVSGGDVYVAGYEFNEQGYAVATLWKNGSPQHLSDGTYSAFAVSVTVSGGDVYVAGSENVQGRRIATLWINATHHRLSDGTNNAEAHSVFVK
ncbi:MAG: Ig-like domain-containing protein [Holophagales bacterium]|jgi:hypothetical protein|nr:Ig-like domain-containing protein [Holophagales bacterium]